MFISVVLPAPFSPSRAWMVPGTMERSMWSLATRLPKRFVMPCSSRFTRPPASFRPPHLDLPARTRVPGPGRRPRAGNSTIRPGLRDRGLRRGLDRPADDPRLDRGQLGLQAGRDLAGEIVIRRERDAVVGQRADVVTALEAAV